MQVQVHARQLKFIAIVGDQKNVLLTPEVLVVKPLI
jgi:hypothetical protein